MPSNLPTERAASAVQQYLAKLTPAAQAKADERRAARGRLIFALDATASREPTWDQASRITHEMFDATAGLAGLDVQLVYYRGYDECRASRWLTNAADLHRLMHQVRCEAGETQIERVLTHVIRETGARKVNALVFVGDAMEESVDRLCRYAGELGRLGVPVFMFHEGNDPIAASAFRQIAILSHGACFSFDLASADRLRELLGAVAVYATGGLPALERHRAKAPAVVRLLTTQLKG